MTSVDSKTILEQAGWVRRLAARLVADPHLAEDIAQTTCVLALERPPESGGNLRAWLRRVMQNVLRDNARKARRRVEHERRVGGPGEEPSTEEMCVRLQLQREVVDAVEALSEKYRRVVLLRYFDDLPPREIAKRLGLPVATVNSQLARAMQQLRSRLDASHGGDRRAWVVGWTSWLGSSGATPLVTAGVITMKAKVLSGAAVAAVAVGIWLGTGSGGEHDRPIVDDVNAQVRQLDRVPAADPEPVRDSVATVADSEESAALPLFRGRVLDIEGSGVAARTVALPDSGVVTTTDSDGAFELPAPNRSVRLAVEEPGWTTVMAARVGPRVIEDAVEPVIVIAGSIEIAGEVVDEAGAPVPNARLECRLPGDFLARLPVVLDSSKYGTWGAESDAGGRFEFAGVPAVRGARLHVACDGFEPSLELLPTQSRTDMRIELRRLSAEPGTVVGQVVDPHGIPAAGAYVFAGRGQTRCDGRGRFSLQMKGARGIRVIQALHRGYLPATHEFEAPSTVVEEQQFEFLVLRLGAEPLTVRGRVVDTHGTPRPGVRVWAADPTFASVDGSYGSIESYLGGGKTDSELREAFGPDADEDRSLYSRQQTSLWSWVTTGADGQFELGGLTDREYRIRALDFETLANAESDAPVRAGSDGVEIRFDERATRRVVGGRVVARDGEPLEGIEVHTRYRPIHMTHKDDRWDVVIGVPWVCTPAVTDADGRFRITDLGAHNVTIRVTGDRIVPRRFGGADGFPTDLGPIDDMRIEVSRRVHCRVELSDASVADRVWCATADGSREYVHVFSGPMIGRMSDAKLHEGKSQVFAVSEDVREFVLVKGETEVARVSVRLTAGEVNVVRH